MSHRPFILLQRSEVQLGWRLDLCGVWPGSQACVLYVVCVVWRACALSVLAFVLVPLFVRFCFCGAAPSGLDCCDSSALRVRFACASCGHAVTPTARNPQLRFALRSRLALACCSFVSVVLRACCHVGVAACLRMRVCFCEVCFFSVAFLVVLIIRPG